MRNAGDFELVRSLKILVTRVDAEVVNDHSGRSLRRNAGKEGLIAIGSFRMYTSEIEEAYLTDLPSHLLLSQ